MKLEFRVLDNDLSNLEADEREIDNTIGTVLRTGGHVDIYTGRKDMSTPRVKIYNHDIVKTRNGNGISYEVMFVNGAFRLVKDELEGNVLTKELIRERGVRVISNEYIEAPDEDEGGG